MKINFNNIIIPLEQEKIIATLKKFLQCKICMNILNNPYDCQCCNQTFCKDCISNYIKTNNKCPYEEFYHNNSNSKKTIISRLNNLKSSSANFTNVLNILRFHCQYKKNGCNKILCLEEVTQHEKKCRYSKNNNYKNSVKKNSEDLNYNYKNNFENMENLNVNEIIRHQDSCVSFQNIDYKFNNNDNNSQNTDNYPTTINTTINNDNLDKIEQSLIQINFKLNSFINEIIENKNNMEKKIIKINTTKEKEIKKLFEMRLKKNDNKNKLMIKTETSSECNSIIHDDTPISCINTERESIKEYFSNYPQNYRFSAHLPTRKNDAQTVKNEMQSKILKKNMISNKNEIKVKMKNNKRKQKIKSNSNDFCSNLYNNIINNVNSNVSYIDNKDDKFKNYYINVINNVSYSDKKDNKINKYYKNINSNVSFSDNKNNKLNNYYKNDINKSINKDNNIIYNNKNVFINKNIAKKEKNNYSADYTNLYNVLSDKENENDLDKEELYKNIIKVSKRINNIENLLNSKDSSISLNEEKNEIINDNIKKINHECIDLKKENNLSKKYIIDCTENILEKMNIKIADKLSEFKKFLSEKSIENIREYVVNLNKDILNLYCEKFDSLKTQITDL